MGKRIAKLTVDPDTNAASTTILGWEAMLQEIQSVTTWYTPKLGDDMKRTFVPMPQIIAKTVLAQILDKLPKLDMIVGTPFFDKNGNLVATPGYHKESATYYAPAYGLNVTLPPERPTQDDVAAALSTAMEPFIDFPFDGPSSKAHTLAMLLQPLVRNMIDGRCPAYLITKPRPDTGAGYLAESIHAIAFGGSYPTSSVKNSDEEWDKFLLAKLRSSAPMIVIDNVPISYELKASSLAKYMTDDAYSGRILGKSDDAEIAVRNMRLSAVSSG